MHNVYNHDEPMGIYNIPGVNPQYLPKSNALRITSFIALPSDTGYRDVYQRTYNINGSRATVDKINDVFIESKVNVYGKINPLVMARMAPNIINLSDRPTGIAQIPNGWNQRRLQFTATVETIMDEIVHVSYIQGYSEYHDPTLSGRLDPKMKFYINSITDVQRRVDPITGYITSIPRQTYNVITDAYGGKRYEEIDNHPTLSLVRPVDIVDSIALSNRHNEYGVNVIKDMSTELGLGNVSTSNKANNDPLSYFTSTVNSFITGQTLTSMGHDYADVLSQASGTLKEPRIVSNPFIFAIHTVTGETAPTSFTLEILDCIDPGVHVRVGDDHVGVIANSNFMTAHDTAETYQTDTATIKALTVVQMLNTFMGDCLVGRIGVSFTNSTGHPFVDINDFKSFIPDLHPDYEEQYVRKIYEKIVHVLLPKITDENQTLVEVNVHSDITTDTSIRIAINNYPEVIYRLPTFADSLYCPMVSNADDKLLLTNDFAAVFDSTYASNNQQY